jgi:DNA polymerase III epsilon subunit-like protein
MGALFIVIFIGIVFWFLIKSSKRNDGNSQTVISTTPKSIVDDGEVVTIKRTKVKPEDMEFPKSKTNIPEIIVFDTETTGIPETADATKRNCKNFPRIVQIAWMVFDDDIEMIKSQSYIIKQEESTPVSSIEIHGITDEIAKEKGVCINDVLNEFLSDIKTAKVLVAHNMKFDYNVVKSELYRNNLDTDAIENIHKCCTMLISKDYCAIERYGSADYKYPTLAELYMKCFPEKILHKKMLHNALFDVAVCAKCLCKLYQENVI